MNTVSTEQGPSLLKIDPSDPATWSESAVRHIFSQIAISGFYNEGQTLASEIRLMLFRHTLHRIQTGYYSGALESARQKESHLVAILLNMVEEIDKYVGIVEKDGNDEAFFQRS